MSDMALRQAKLLWFAFVVDPRAAIRGVVCQLKGMRVRSKNILQGAASRHPDYYSFWLRVIEPGLRAKRLGGSAVGKLPTIEPVIVMGINDSIDDSRRTVACLRRLLGPERDFRIIAPMAGGAASGKSCALNDNGLREICSAVTTDYLWPLRAGDVIDVRFEQSFFYAIKARGLAPVIYWDEDRVSRNGTHEAPWFKPDWNALQFLGQDYLTGACMIRADIARRTAEALVGGFEVDQLVAFAVRHGGGDPLHIASVLTHHSGSSTAPQSAARHASLIANAFGVPTRLDPQHPDIVRPAFESVSPSPSVSFIIPIRDQIQLLRTCIQGLDRLEYLGPIQIIVVDNDSNEDCTRAYLNELRERGVIVLSHPGVFNYSTINNRAVDHATGEYICLLNNDIEMLDGEWLGHMMRYATQSRIGAVGAKLLYPDRSIQHAGVVVGQGGAAGHPYRGWSNDTDGHRSAVHVARYATAVTAACLLVKRQKFLKVGGFDADRFAVAFNDVDLCLRLAEAGWRNVYCPEAVLIHHESKSRGDDMAPANLARFKQEVAYLQDRWRTATYIDPYLNLNFSRRSETLDLEWD